MKFIKFGIFITLIMNSLLLGSCKKENFGQEPHYVIYKLRGDYVKNVVVLLSSDKLKLEVYPDPGDPCGDSTCNPVSLENSYYLDYNTTYGLNSAYLKITKSDYKKIFPISPDSIYSLVLDNDPFLEYYIDKNKLFYLQGTVGFIFDTAKINALIVADSLSYYLKNIKGPY